MAPLCPLLIEPATAKYGLLVYLLPNSICMQVQHRGVRLAARTDVVIHPATTTFRATRGQLNRYLQIWELKTTKALQVLRACQNLCKLLVFVTASLPKGSYVDVRMLITFVVQP